MGPGQYSAVRGQGVDNTTLSAMPDIFANSAKRLVHFLGEFLRTQMGISQQHPGIAMPGNRLQLDEGIGATFEGVRIFV